MVRAPAHESSPRRAVFLDRDGVLIEEQKLLTDENKVRLLPGAADAVRDLQRRDFAVLVATNQTVVARGMCSEDDVHAVHARIDELLRRQGAQPLLAYRVCFHHPEANVAGYRQQCACRKPLPGLLIDAAAEYGLDLARSYMVGDRMSDVAAGRRAGCTSILVESGAHREPPIVSDFHDDTVKPDAVCADLRSAARWILRSVA